MSYADNIPLTYVPNYAQKSTTKFNTEPLKFGDGYSQLVGTGCNLTRREYNLTYTRSPDVCDTIETLVLSTKTVGKILWTPLNGAAGMWTYKEYRRIADTMQTQTISFTLTEAFF